MSQNELIQADELARHLYCARALAYDRAFPDAAISKTPLERLARWGFYGWIVATLLIMALAYLSTSSLLLVAMIFMIGIIVPLFLRLSWQRRKKVVTVEGIRAKRVRKPMVAENVGLIGKPDYLVTLQETAIPILTKRGNPPPEPYESHVVQVLAYCALVQVAYQKSPSYGIIRYDDGSTFEVEYYETAVDDLWEVMKQVMANRKNSDVPKNHDERRRCYACRHRNQCEESLYP